MLITLDPHLRQVLGQVVQAAGPLKVALVGGAVRDLLLHRVHHDPWRGLPDLDLVVEDPGRPTPRPEDDPWLETGTAGLVPAAHRVARRLQTELGPSLRYCQLHAAYGTAELEIDGVLLDLATARRERYEEPGANPRVSGGSLEDDLARRDLSINAMALVLRTDPLATGAPLQTELLDPFGGQADLAAKRLRFLHPTSLSDDPSRVVRAARYGARLGMDLANDSLEQLRSTLKAWPWSHSLNGPEDGVAAPPALGTRLRMELEVLLGREPWVEALSLLQSWGGLALLDPELQSDHGWRRRLRWAERLLVLAHRPPWPTEQWRLLALLASLPDPLAPAGRLQLPHRTQRQMHGLVQLRSWLADQAEFLPLRPSAITDGLERQGITPEAVLLAIVTLPPRPWRRPLLRWLLRWRSTPAPLTAGELIRQGIPPGPELGERLRALRSNRLDLERS